MAGLPKAISSTRAAATSGLIGGGAVVIALLGGLPSERGGLALLLGASLGAATILAASWRCVATHRGRMPLGFAALAGLAAGLAGHLLAWLFFYGAVVWTAEPVSLADLGRAFWLTLTMGAFSVFLVGHITLPAAIGMAMLAALLGRRRVKAM